MPYVIQEIRPDLEKFVTPIVDAMSCLDTKTDGKLVYIFCRVIYQIYGRGDFSILGRGKLVLDESKDEYRRKVIVPHEDKKCELNGEVFE